MILGDSALIPLHDRESNQNAVLEVDLKHRHVKILRGVGGSITHRFISSSQSKQKNKKMFVGVEEEPEGGEIKEQTPKELRASMMPSSSFSM